ncbi:MAG: hypothetical protein HQK86_00805 [Nitrospinae bacterium]|nr:hypothetical protein [Nitrospinota bacterium]MBF0635024.1 hypothetical protein [Nitrospinota bacterium]
MSETGEEKEAIELIAEAEKEIRARIDAARRAAKHIVTEAETQAAQAVRAKEAELKALEMAGYSGGNRPDAGGEAVTIPAPPKELVDRLAMELFTRIIGETAKGQR